MPRIAPLALLLALALLLLTALAGSSCALHRLDADLAYVRTLVRRFDCRDGAPAKVLVDPHCVDGICGVTCAPGRWTTTAVPPP